MSNSHGVPDSNRHWFVTVSSIACFATGLALLLSQFYHPSTVDFHDPRYWLYAWMWSLLDLFPQPASASSVAMFYRPWRDFVNGHTAAALLSNVVVFLFSLALGWALWRRRSWARPVLAALCILKIAAVLGNIATYGRQFTYCADSSIYPCSKNLAVRLLPFYGVSVAGILISVAALVFLWRYGLEPRERTSAVPEGVTKLRSTNAALQVCRWIVIGVSAGIAFDYLYYALRSSPSLLPRFAGSGHALAIRLLLPLIFLILVSYGIVIARLFRGADKLGFALAAGTGLACALAWFAGIGAEETPGLPFLLGIGDWPVFPLVPWFSVAIYLSLFLLAMIALSFRGQHRSPAGSLGAAFILPLVLVFSWPQVQANLKSYSTFSRFPKPTPEKQSANDRQTAALDLVKTYRRCVFLYRETHLQQGFPTSAAAIGPGGSGCLTAAEVSGQLDGYQARYEAAPADASGAVTQFHLFVLRTESATPYDLGYFFDASGVITGLTRKAVQFDDPGGNPNVEPPATDPLRRGGPLSSGVLYRIRMLRDCLARVRDSDPAKQYPVTMEPLFDAVGAYGYPCISVYDRAEISRSDLRANGFIVPLNVLDDWDARHRGVHYSFRYAVRTDPAGNRIGYTLMAQPLKYNEDGVRSYFVDETGTVRATSDNRAAAVFDPEAPLCERAGGQCLDLIPSYSSDSQQTTHTGTE